jgi:hypothetical protein
MPPAAACTSRLSPGNTFIADWSAICTVTNTVGVVDAETKDMEVGLGGMNIRCA